MDEFDKMKKRYLLKNNCKYITEFTIKTVDELPEELKIALINHTLQDIRRFIVEKGDVSADRLKRCAGVISIRTWEFEASPLEILQSLKRNICSVTIPLWFYKRKGELNTHLNEIMKYTNTFLEIIVSHDVTICIFGKLDDTIKARSEVFKMIEWLMGRDSITIRGYFKTHNLVGLNLRVFNISRINCDQLLISAKKPILTDIGGSLCPFEDVLSEVLRYETLKLSYILYYKRNEIEDILCECNCYLKTEVSKNPLAKTMLVGFTQIDITKCKKKLKEMLQDIIKVTYNKRETLTHAYEIFTFESERYNKEIKNDYRFLSVGVRSEIKKFLKRCCDYFDVEIDIDSDLEDFLCGKKNGKINKICRENCADVVIHTKINEGEKKMVIFLSGQGKNVYKTIESLEQEFPAEICFSMDEKHHRRIIGYGGKNIQRIMKKHGVYIKFMNEDDRIASGISGNVIVKTPLRNKEALEQMKKEVLSMADEENTLELLPEIRIDIFYYYEYLFKNLTFFYNHVVVREDINAAIKVYIVTEKDIASLEKTDLDVIIRVERLNEIVLLSPKSFENFELITSKNWMDSPPVLSFKLFDSVLFHPYQPLLSKEYVDVLNYKINFSERHNRMPGLNDDCAVGNSNKGGNKKGK